MVAVKYGGNYYYYLRNAQGDIVKLIDEDGATVVEYTYNTWGKKVTTTGSMTETLGRWQPFRYRGYVLDPEWGIYYLNSRYYDPNSARFLSPDTYLSTGQGVLGHNAYAYCLDNPVMGIDPDGREDEWIDPLIFPSTPEKLNVDYDYLNSFCKLIFENSVVTYKDGYMTFSLFVPECENAIYDAAKEMGQDYMYDFIVYVAEVHLSYINESYSISEKNRKSLKRKLSNEIGKYMSIEHPKTFRKRTLAMEISFFWSKICPDRREGFIKVYKNLYKNISVKVRLNEEAGGLDK